MPDDEARLDVDTTTLPHQMASFSIAPCANQEHGTNSIVKRQSQIIRTHIKRSTTHPSNPYSLIYHIGARRLVDSTAQTVANLCWVKQKSNRKEWTNIYTRNWISHKSIYHICRVHAARVFVVIYIHTHTHKHWSAIDQQKPDCRKTTHADCVSCALILATGWWLVMTATVTNTNKYSSRTHIRRLCCDRFRHICIRARACLSVWVSFPISVVACCHLISSTHSHRKRGGLNYPYINVVEFGSRRSNDNRQIIVTS